MISIKLKGLKEFKRNLAKNSERIKQATALAIYDEGVELINKSVPLAPYDLGYLRGSYFASLPKIENPKVRVGFDTTYALVMHEKHPTMKHFLQRPYDEMRAGYKARLAKRIKRNWEQQDEIKRVKAPQKTRRGYRWTPQ